MSICLVPKGKPPSQTCLHALSGIPESPNHFCIVNYMLFLRLIWNSSPESPESPESVEVVPGTAPTPYSNALGARMTVAHKLPQTIVRVTSLPNPYPQPPARGPVLRYPVLFYGFKFVCRVRSFLGTWGRGSTDSQRYKGLLN